MSLLSFVIEHWGVLLTFVLALIAVVKVTAWGRANAAALQLIIEVIEQLQLRTVKQEVANRQEGLPEIAQDAITDAVAVADAKQTPLPLILRIGRELFRGLFGR